MQVSMVDCTNKQHSSVAIIQQIYAKSDHQEMNLK